MRVLQSASGPGSPDSLARGRDGRLTLGIAMSGYPYPSNVDEPGTTGFHYHLTKPVNCDDLCSLLEKSRASKGDAPITV